MRVMEEVYIPDDGWGGLSSFTCPDCGDPIKNPYAGYKWECHEEYGGCGAAFEPRKVFKRVDNE